MTSDYKKYSLDKLQEWVHDAMNSDASPHEIYSAIREAVREDYYYHKNCISRATGLLELLSGHRPVADISVQYTDEELNAMCDKAAAEEEKKNKVKKWRWVLPVEETTNSETGLEEYFVTFPNDLLYKANLKEGDEVEWVDQGDGSYLLKKIVKSMIYDEMIAKGYEMSADGFWLPPQNC